MLTHDRLFIGGAWVEPATRSRLNVVSPSSEETIGWVPDADETDLAAAVGAARAAYDVGPWPRMAAAERAGYLDRLADQIAVRREEFEAILVDEAGLALGLWASVEPAIRTIRYYAELARAFDRDELRTGAGGQQVLVRWEAVGVVAAILPWNSPMSIGFMKLAPALASGCTIVFKPAPETPLHAMLLAQVLAQIDLPPGVLNVLPAGREVSEALVRHPGVDKVSFTGSTAVGRKVGAICGSELKRCSLELGGKSAAIVLEDVDLEESLPRLVGAAMMNNGQACVLQSRILVPRSRYAEMTGALAGAIGALPVGDPHTRGTFFGPLIAARQRDRVEGFISSAVEDGATVALGGGRPAGLTTGWYVEPTVLTDVDNTMPIARQEVFGPVVAVIPYADDDDAVDIANDSPYGLSGTVWTTDVERGLRVADRVRAGNYGINLFAMDAVAPFGGYKESGIGRELGVEGLKEFMQCKAIHLPGGWTPARAPDPGVG